LVPSTAHPQNVGVPPGSPFKPYRRHPGDFAGITPRGDSGVQAGGGREAVCVRAGEHASGGGRAWRRIADSGLDRRFRIRAWTLNRISDPEYTPPHREPLHADVFVLGRDPPVQNCVNCIPTRRLDDFLEARRHGVFSSSHQTYTEHLRRESWRRVSPGRCSRGMPAYSEAPNPANSRAPDPEPEPWTRNSKPETRNSKPETLNP